MKELELFYAEILKCTVIHGSSVRINGKNVLLMGERWSGKTTLIQYLTLDKKGKYLGDDCIYIINGSYVGFGMPLPVRSARNPHYDEYFIVQTDDTDHIMRTLYLPPEYTGRFQGIDIVAFPKYGAGSINQIKKKTPAEAFNKIIKNVRASNDMKTLFTDIKNLAANSDCYSIEYSSSGSAYELLFK